MSETVYLNGAYVPYEKALVPVEDRGNVFGDGVYEVIRFYGGRPLMMRAHMERLVRSAREIRLPEVDAGRLSEVALELVRRNGIDDGTLYLQVSRGVAPRNHAFPEVVHPTVFMIARPLPRPAPAIRREGVACITVPDIRWLRCDIKSICLLPNVLAKQRAKEAGAYEAIFVRDGIATEGTSSNLFAVRDGRLLTHPSGEHILPGITRRLVISLAEREGIAVAEEVLEADAIVDSDELFVSGTTTEIRAVISIDGRPVGSGRPGPVTLRLLAQYDRVVDEVRRSGADPLASADRG